MQLNLVLSEHLVALVNRFATPSSLRDIRDVSLCLLAFAGFFALRRLKSRLRCSDLYFFQDHIVLHVSKIRTDQLGKGYSCTSNVSALCTCCFVMLLWLSAT